MLLLAAVETALLLSQPGAPWQLALFPVSALAWFAGGAVAALRRPASGIGTIMLVGGLVLLAAGLGNAPYPTLTAVGMVVATLPLALVAHLLHAFPSGRLHGTASRVIVGGLYGTALVLQAPRWLFRADSPLQIANRPDLVELGQTVQHVVGGVLMLATAVILIGRLRATPAAQRRVLAPLALYGVATVVLIPVLSRVRGPLLGDDPLTLFTIQAILLGLAPVAFVLAVLRGGFTPTPSARELSVRVAEAADDERRRIARDLHDGVQGRLVRLALRAGELERQAGDVEAVRGSADALRRELDATMRELRELVRGVLPAALVESGLGAAAEDLADRMPLPTTVEAGDERYPSAVESALWFVISEALANVAKHADASTATVLVVPTSSGVRIEVRDDGRGGATAGLRPDGGGSGLRGIADRVDVLGGRLTVDSPPGGGTRIVAEVPCAS